MGEGWGHVKHQIARARSKQQGRAAQFSSEQNRVCQGDTQLTASDQQGRHPKSSDGLGEARSHGKQEVWGQEDRTFCPRGRDKHLFFCSFSISFFAVSHNENLNTSYKSNKTKS